MNAFKMPVFLLVYGGGKCALLGRMLPRGGELFFSRRLTKNDMRSFPPVIEYAGELRPEEKDAPPAPSQPPPPAKKDRSGDRVWYSLQGGVLFCPEEKLIALPARLRELWGQPDAYVGIVHRLDTGVSGLMVCARTPKAAAALTGNKKIEMVHVKDLLGLTGYIRGGCSPIGMKKLFPTVLDETAILYDTIFFSGGKVGYQVEVAPDDLLKLVPYKMADITCE